MKKYLLPLETLLLCLSCQVALAVQAVPLDLYPGRGPLNYDWLALRLFALGAGLLFLELFIPGFGICGVLGITSIVASFYFGLGGSQDTLKLLAVGMVVVIALSCLFLKFLPHNRVWQKLTLKHSEKHDVKLETADLSSFIGKQGITASALRPSGVATINGKRLPVVTSGEFLESGTVVVVTAIEGRKIIVQKEQ